MDEEKQRQLISNWTVELQKVTTISPEHAVVKVGAMIEIIKTEAFCGGRNDWIRYNPALKIACNKIDINTSKELREIFKED